MALTLEQSTQVARKRQELCGDLKELLVERLTLDVDPKLIGDDQPLFGRGLELDSIDTLELAMAVEDKYGVVVTDDDTESLLSLNRLADHLEANQGDAKPYQDSGGDGQDGGGDPK